MKKIFLLLFVFMAFNIYAQEDVNIVADNTTTSDNTTISDNASNQNMAQDDIKIDNATKEETIENKSDVATSKKSKPDFNKKKISLDRLDAKKWSLHLGYNYFMPDDKDVSIFTNKLKVGGGYLFNKNFQLQLFLNYANGSKDYTNDEEQSATTKGTLYNIGVLATGLYPIELSVGSLAPFGGIGAVYTFGSLKYSNEDTGDEIEQKNLSGGGVLVQAGVQYNYNIFIARAYLEYLYDFTSIKHPDITSLSGFSIGVDVGIKF